MQRFKIMEDVLGGGRFHNLAIALFLFGIVFATVDANAACGDPRGFKPGFAAKLLHAGQPGQASERVSNDNSIVGLWHVIYTEGGQEFYEALDQWHGDGTEFENAYLSPIGGNICLGAWKQDKSGNIHLHHVGWVFDTGGNPAGFFTLDQTDKVSVGGNTYAGEFVYNQYDGNGNLILKLNGTQTASRISVQ